MKGQRVLSFVSTNGSTLAKNTRNSLLPTVTSRPYITRRLLLAQDRFMVVKGSCMIDRWR